MRAVVWSLLDLRFRFHIDSSVHSEGIHETWDATDIDHGSHMCGSISSTALANNAEVQRISFAHSGIYSQGAT